MIKEYGIKDWNSFIRTICEIADHQEYRMWYRGQADYEWGLIPSVQRPEYHKKGNEQYMATNFMIYTMRLNGEAPAQYDRSSWLSLMQHYGLPTRLLDWSESPLVALYFALNSQLEKDAALWIVNPMRLNQKMGYGKYVPPMNYGGINDYLEGAFDDKRPHTEKIIACHGIGSDLRMYVQQSNFTIHDTQRRLDQILDKDPGCNYLYKIRIPAQIKQEFVKELNILGIHDSTVYPDMEHVAESKDGSLKKVETTSKKLGVETTMKNEENRKNPFWNAKLPIEERLDWLLANLTLEEKITCMASTVPALPRFGIDMNYVGGEAAHGVEARNDQNGRNIPEPTTSFPQPIGMSASWDTELIKKAGEVTGTEARVLWHRHPIGGLSRWAPTVDLERDPRWGRNEEGYGEDPVLTGAMAGAYIEGMQGDDPHYLRIAATLKHFYANNTEHGRGWKNASIDPRNMHELYLEPFRRCIEEHGAEAVMTAYNKINGIPGMLNLQVKSILKKQYGLKHAVCDGGAMELVRNLHHYFGTHAQSLAASVKAGVDAMSDPVPVVEEAAREALEFGLLSEEEMDEAIRNVFRTKLKLGMFDDTIQNPYDRVTEADLNSRQAQEICLELTRKSIVLLKNENDRLPLSETLHKNPVLVGPLCDVWHQDWYGGEPHHRSTLKEGLEQLLHTKIDCADGWDRITLRAGDQYVAVQEDGTLCLSDQADLFVKEDWGDGRINFRCVRTGKYVTTISKERRHSEDEDGSLVAVKDAAFDWFVTAIFHILPGEENTIRLTNRFDQPIRINDEKKLYSALTGEGTCFTMETVVDGCEEAARLAQHAETVILALGCHPMVNAKEEIDRTTLALPPHQEKLAQRISTISPNAVCVLFSNYPYTIHTVQNTLPAIVWSATGSQDMGTVMAQTLYGKNAPAGRFNMTWYNSDDDLPDIDDYDIIRGKRTYRYFDKKVLYPFGHGLTYTKFSYSNLSVQMAGLAHIEVTFDIQNIGKMTSDEVVQIYASAPKSRVPKPRRQLLAFARLHDIAPNEIRHVTKRISISELRFYDCISDSFLVEEGNYSIFVGSSSENTPLDATIFLAGETTGMRVLTKRIRADHFDEYENIELTQGILNFTAVTAKDKEKPARLQWRDCQAAEVREAHFLAKSAQGGSIELIVNGKRAAFWSGDTRLYEPTPMFELDDNAKKERNEQQKVCKPIYSDITVPFDKSCFDLNAFDPANVADKEQAQVQKCRQTVSIFMTGDVSLCCFGLK